MFLIICLGTAAIAYSRIADNESVEVTACYDGQPHSAIGTVKVNNPNETVVWYDSNGNIVTFPSLTEPGTTTFYGDKWWTYADKTDMQFKPQIVPHKVEIFLNMLFDN